MHTRNVRFYGMFSEEQFDVFSRCVKGKNVIDLGCGHEAPLCHLAVAHGASFVMGVDKELSPRSRRHFSKNMILWEKDFLQIEAAMDTSWRIWFDQMTPFDIAIVSWPINSWQPGLTSLLERANRILYLGKNTNGLSCGDEILFSYFLTRRIEESVQNSVNDMTLYGDRCEKREPETLEEISVLMTKEIVAWREVRIER